MLQVPQKKTIARLQNNEIKEENLMNKLNRKLIALNMLSGKITELKLQDFADLDTTDVVSVDAKVMVDE
jgi:hypothetical protein